MPFRLGSLTVGVDVTLPDGYVDSDKLADGAVTTPKVFDDAVTNAKMAVNAVDVAQIIDDAITQAKISAGAVGTTEIAALAVTAAEIAAAAVTTAKIDAAAVTTAKIANAAITTALIDNAAVTNAKIDSLSADKITAGSIDTTEYIQSSNYSAGSAGWRIDGDGDAEFNNVDLRGSLEVREATDDYYILMDNGILGFFDVGTPNTRAASIFLEDSGGSNETLVIETAAVVGTGGAGIIRLPGAGLNNAAVFGSEQWDAVVKASASGRRVRLEADDEVRIMNGSSVHQFTITDNNITNGRTLLKRVFGNNNPALKFNSQGTSGNENIQVRNEADSAFRKIEASAFTVSSDRGIKDQIRNIPTDETQEMQTLRAKAFDVVGADGVRIPNQRGFIAQDVPESARLIMDEETGELGIDMMAMIALIWEEVVRLRTVVERARP